MASKRFRPQQLVLVLPRILLLVQTQVLLQLLPLPLAQIQVLPQPLVQLQILVLAQQMTPHLENKQTIRYHFAIS